MSYLADLDGAEPSLGGKARSLARLAAAGLATPAGFVIRDALFRAICPKALQCVSSDQASGQVLDEAVLASLEVVRKQIEGAAWPPFFSAELAARLDRLGCDRFSVRSSFASEDTAGALAAGVYESRVNVPRDEVESAIRRVLVSALSPGAAAYAMAHGRSPGAPPVAVLVHAYLAGDAEGSAAYAPESGPVWMVRRGSLAATATAALEAALRQLARAFGPVEIEWVLGAGGLSFLQLRPYQGKAVQSDWPGWKELGPVERDERDVWHWDMAHNPLPLSPAQTGLVALVDERCRIGIRQRVLGGYLFFASDNRPRPSAIEPSAARAYFESLRDEFEAGRNALGPTPSLEAALSLFTSIYQGIFGLLQPALKRARAELRMFLEQNSPVHLPLLPALCSGAPSMAEERRRRAAAIRDAAAGPPRGAAQADYLALFGDEAPVWDVSVPTYAEDPAPLLLSFSVGLGQAAGQGLPDWQAAAQKVHQAVPQEQRHAWRTILTAAREATALAEADDWLYARAQSVVRHALRAIGQTLQRKGRLTRSSDVFLLPLPVLRDLDVGGDLDGMAARGGEAWESARQHPPPAELSGDDKVVRGHGTGGHAIGTIAVHHAGNFSALPADAVLLAKTLLPTELPLITAAAIVTETGGPLDHVAAQARERGIPAVVGATGAGNQLTDGDLVLLDGERGLVVKLGRRSPAD